MDTRFYVVTKRTTNNIWIDVRLEEDKCKMDMYQKLRNTNAYQSKAASWMRVGDRVTNNFFEVVKCKDSGTQPSCLKKIHGTMTTCKEERLKMAMSYYMQLLNVCNEEHIEQDAFRNIINMIPKRVTAQMMDRLNTSICI